MSAEPAQDPPAAAAGEFFRAAWIFYLLLAVAGVIWLGLAQGDLTLELFARPERMFYDLAWGGLAAALLLGLWLGGRRFVPAMAELESQIASAIGPIDRAEVVVLALVSGFTEELFFRGALLGSWGPWVSTALFALVHSGRGRGFHWWTLFALIAGGLFAGLTWWTGSLLAAMWGHVLVNAVSLWRLAEKGRLGESAGDPPRA